jgi:hypothetical protein
VRSQNGVVVSGVRRGLFRLGAAAGIAGPAAFTGAWIASSLRQAGQGPGGLQLSGLAAPDARDPQIMMSGFAVLGGCTLAFGAALREALRTGPAGGAGPGPALVQGAGTPARQHPAKRPAAASGEPPDGKPTKRKTGQAHASHLADESTGDQP